MYYTSKKYKLFTVHERDQCEHVNAVNAVNAVNKKQAEYFMR